MVTWVFCFGTEPEIFLCLKKKNTVEQRHNNAILQYVIYLSCFMLLFEDKKHRVYVVR